MAKWGKVEFDDLKKFQQQLEKLEQSKVDKFCEDCSKELAARLLALVIPRTPVGKKPKFLGDKTVKIKGEFTGKSRTMFTSKGAIYEKYWGGYSGGTLRRGWTGGKVVNAKEYAQSLPIYKSGDNFTVVVMNPVEYASYVEYGHRQEAGRFVPALGKRLKNGLTYGKFFLTKSECILVNKAPEILQRKLKEFLKEAFSDASN